LCEDPSFARQRLWSWIPAYAPRSARAEGMTVLGGHGVNPSEVSPPRRRGSRKCISGTAERQSRRFPEFSHTLFSPAFCRVPDLVKFWFLEIRVAVLTNISSWPLLKGRILRGSTSRTEVSAGGSSDELLLYSATWGNGKRQGFAQAGRTTVERRGSWVRFSYASAYRAARTDSMIQRIWIDSNGGAQ
jgi:hypothetical protein